MLGTLFVGVGFVAASWGAVTALGAPRPRCLGGALVAAVGLAVAMLGAVAVAVPGFL